ncbi:MAG: class F sortase [Rhodoglobus sp.]
MTIRYIIAAATVLLLVGCTATPVVQPIPERTKAEVSTSVPEIPRSSALLSTPRPAMPPVAVDIPAAGIAVPVSPMGIRDDGLMDIPENVAIAGWYSYGSDPFSETGTTVIAAHVDSLEYGLGPFAKLKSLDAGSEIIVAVADGSSMTYRVESITNYPKAALPVADLFDRAGDRRLALITCGGQFDYSTRTYSDNVVVIARPVAS